MTMRWTIRAKLAALVLAVLLPLVGGAVCEFWLDLMDDRADAQTRLLVTAEGLARHLDEILSGQIENLEALASVRSLDRIRDDDLRMLAARVRERHPFIHRFVAATPDGHITASSLSGAADGDSSLVDPAVPASVLGARKPSVGPPQPSREGIRIVSLMVPIVGGDDLALGVVAAEIDLRSLSVFLGGIRPSHASSAAVVTADGTLIARSGATTPDLGQALATAPGARSLIGARGGVAEWRGNDGVVTLGGAASMTVAPWMVVVAMPRDLAYGPAAAQLRRNLSGLTAITLAALVAAWLISRRMTRSVRTLIEGVRGLAAGEGSAITAETGDELAELAGQFNLAVAERRRAEAATEARQRRIQALAEVNLALSRQLDLEPLLQQITQALVQLTGARSAVLWEADHATRTLVRRAWSLHGSIASMDLPETLTLDQGGAGWIARHREPLFIDDVAHDDRIVAVDWALRHDMVAFAGAPVVAGDRLLGVLTLNLARGTLPQGDDRGLLLSFASQAAVAIRNAQLFAETDARRRAAETLSDLGGTLSQALDPDAVARRIVDSVRALLSVQHSGLYVLEAESGDLAALAVSGDGSGAFDPRVRFPVGTGVVALAVRHRRPVATLNLLTDARVILTPELRARIERASYRAVLAIPMIVKGMVLGALAVTDREGRIFSEEESQLAQAFADQAALALGNARLYEETRQRLRHLDSLREVVEQILVPVSLEERLNLIAKKTAELFDADRVTIALRDEGRDELVVRAGHGIGEGEIGRRLPDGTGTMGVAITRRTGVVVNDYAAWPHRDAFIIDTYRERPLRAVMACPLFIRDQVIGALSVGVHASGKAFIPSDLDRLASLAVPAALAIEHSRLYDELAARLRELQDAQAQLVQAGKLSAVGQLVSGVAHELNNPLSVVIGYGQLLMNRGLPPEIRRPIELIVSQGDRMARIVQSLLLFSRQRKPERGAVDVRTAIEQTIGLRAAQFVLSDIRVETAYGDGVPSAEGDTHQLQQVFLNLLLNAEQAILGSGVGEKRVGDRIHIRTAAHVEDGESWVVIQVADNGPGIRADVLPRLFEPFFTTKKVGEGSGLGLSVSYGIVQQHGGHLTAESGSGRTVFTLRLPAMARAPQRAPEPALVPPARTGNGRLALVVDDEESVLELVTTLLREAGWNVAVATGGHAALERLRRESYDLVVSDVRMPDGSGEALYRTLMAEGRGVAGRFLFMTGDTANPEAWEFLRGAGACVIEKPFTAHALLSAVERVTA